MTQKNIDDGGPAYPITVHPGHGFGPEQSINDGMSLRDWFAGHALSNVYTASEQSPDKAAEWAYQVADAMLAARKGGA